MTGTTPSGETIISGEKDFPRCEIAVAPGPVYRIRFMNREHFAGAEGVLRLICALTLGLVALLLAVPAGKWASAQGLPWVLGPAAVAAAWYGLARLVSSHRRIARMIEIDVPGQAMTVYRGGRAGARFPWPYDSVTVEDHPDRMLEREALRGQTIGVFGKQHCLFGFFGQGGGDKRLILSRFEWPDTRSLREIRTALDWVKARIARQADAPARAGQRQVMGGEG